ncbi:MAG: sulfurtransferase [Methanosarcinales archaeon]|nr:sulfurtransferase [Methanosarcinales archaeon]
MERTYPYPPGEGLAKWVSTDWLKEHLEDRNLMVLDAQPNIHDYIMGHIPGAVYMNEGLLRAAQRDQPAMFVPPLAIQPTLRRIGVEAGRPVVVYTGAGPYSKCKAGMGEGLDQAMVAYCLLRFGHDNVYLLDGGIEKWLEEGKPLTKVYPEAKESDFQAQVRLDFFIEYREFREIKDQDDVVLFDARPRQFYEGQAMWPKPGHIPGAVNLPWRSLMSEKNSRMLRGDQEIREIVSQFDLSKDKTIICSCGTGREATLEFLIFRYYLGYPKVRVYEGSFTEWTSHPENPTVTGPSPR